MAEGNVVGSGGGVPGNAAFTLSLCFSTVVLGGVNSSQSIPVRRRHSCPVGLRVPVGLFCTDLVLQKE